MGLKFSRMGLGLEEARKKEAEMRDIQSEVNETRFMSRGLRQAFRDATRSRDPMAAVAVLDKAKNMGVAMTPGIRAAGSLERAVGNRYYEQKKAWENTQASARQSGNKRKAEEMVAAFGSGNLSKDELIQQGTAIGGNEQSILGLALRMGFKDRLAQYGASPAGGSTPATPGQTPAAQPIQPALKPSASMPNYGGKWEDSIYNPASSSGPNSGAGLSVSGPSGSLYRAVDGSITPTATAPPPIKAPSPLFEAAMARVAAAGGADRDADIAGIERVGNLQGEMEAARQKTDSAYERSRGAGSDADRIMAQHGVAQAFRTRGFAIQAAERAQDNKPLNEQIEQKAGIGRGVVIAEHQGAPDLEKPVLPQNSEMQQAKDFTNRPGALIGIRNWFNKSGPSFYDRPTLDALKPGMNYDQARFDLMTKDGYSAKNADTLLAGRGITREAAREKSKKPKMRDTTASQRAAWEKDVMSNPPVDNPDFAGSIYNKFLMEFFKDPGGKRRATYERLKKEGKVK